jgi:hypothetical protein
MYSLSGAQPTILRCLIVAAVTQAQPSDVSAQAHEYRPTVIIDFAELKGEDLDAIVSGLAGAQHRRAWTKVEVKPNDTLFGIIASRYRFSDALYPELSKALADLISAQNNVAPLRLPVGKVLEVPLLAKRPHSFGSLSTITQIIDTESQSTFTAPSAAWISDDPVKARLARQLPIGSTWTMDLSLAEYDSFIAALPEAVRMRALGTSVYTGPRDQVAFVGVAGGTPAATAAALSTTASPPEELKGVALGHVGKYYLLDFFTSDGTCAHGQLVLDSAAKTLRALGKADWQSRLIPINLDFFGARDAALKEIDNYVKRQTPSIRNQLKAAADAVRGLKPPSSTPKERPYVVPLLYLQALYGNLLASGETDVVSSSFWTLFDGFRVVPATYASDSSVPMLSAVLDDDSSLIEDFNTREPLRSFHEGRTQLGLVLVGASTGPATFMGMSSRGGDGVTVLGDAVVTGETGACKGVTRSGTSFATPVIGAQALAAKAYWRSRNARLAATELKRRLVLAGRRVPEYVGRFASGAVPDFADLLIEAGAVAFRPDGTRFAIPSAIDTSFIDIRSDSGGLPDRLVFRKGPQGFSGLELRDGRVFVYSDGWHRWKHVEIEQLHFVVSTGSPALSSIAELSTHLQKVVLL